MPETRAEASAVALNGRSAQSVYLTSLHAYFRQKYVPSFAYFLALWRLKPTVKSVINAHINFNSQVASLNLKVSLVLFLSFAASAAKRSLRFSARSVYIEGVGLEIADRLHLDLDSFTVFTVHLSVTYHPLVFSLLLFCRNQMFFALAILLSFFTNLNTVSILLRILRGTAKLP